MGFLPYNSRPESAKRTGQLTSLIRALHGLESCTAILRERGCPSCLFSFFTRLSFIPIISCWKAIRDRKIERAFSFIYFDRQDLIYSHGSLRVQCRTGALKKLVWRNAVVTQILFQFTAKCHRRLVLLLLFYGEISGTRLFSICPSSLCVYHSLTGRVYGWAIATTATTTFSILLFFYSLS